MISLVNRRLLIHVPFFPYKKKITFYLLPMCAILNKFFNSNTSIEL